MRFSGQLLVPSSLDDPVKQHFADLIGRLNAPVGGISDDGDDAGAGAGADEDGKAVSFSSSALSRKGIAVRGAWPRLQYYN